MTPNMLEYTFFGGTPSMKSNIEMAILIVIHNAGKNIDKRRTLVQFYVEGIICFAFLDKPMMGRIKY